MKVTGGLPRMQPSGKPIPLDRLRILPGGIRAVVNQ
jgi:hypothetical protein